jgi:hypothetical protein
VNRLRRRTEALERRGRDLAPTAAEEAALAATGAAYPLSSLAMAKLVNRHGLEALVLASFQLGKPAL